MVKLRLRRTGRKQKPSYQIVAIDSRKKRDGSYLEKIGYYYPLSNKSEVDQGKVCKWLGLGAQPTDVVKSIFRKHGVLVACQQTEASVKKTDF